MKLTFRNFGLIALLAVICGLTSCRDSSDNILEMVPESTSMVTVADADALLKNAGCKVSDGIVTLSPDLMSLKSKLNSPYAELIDYLVMAAPTVDLHSVVMFNMGSSVVSVVRLRDSGKFSDAIAVGASSQDRTEGAEFYTLDDIIIAIDGDYAWLSASRASIEQARRELAKGNFAKEYPVFASELTDNSSAVRSVAFVGDNIAGAPLNGVEQNIDKAWALSRYQVTDNMLSADIQLVATDGNPFDFSPVIGEIDPGFLRFVRPSSIMAGAFGKPSNMEEFLVLIEAMIPQAEVPVVKQFIPYLQAVNGTTSVSMTPVGGADALATFAPGAWEYTFTSDFRESEAQSLMHLLQFGGATRLPDVDGGEVAQYTVPFAGTEVYLGLFQGTFAASTGYIRSDFSNSFATAFEGARAGVVIDFAAGSEVSKMLDMPYGIYFSAMLYDTQLKLRFKFNGSDRSTLATLVNRLSLRLPDAEIEETLTEIDEIIPDIVNSAN